MTAANQKCDPGLTARDKRNRRPFTISALLWAASFTTAHLFLPRGDGELASQPLWAWLLVVVSVALGVLLAHYYLRFIRGLDELMRRIHVEALATGFGAAFVFGMGAGLLSQMGVPKVGALTWAVMVLAYSLALRRAQRAYCA